MNNMTQKEILEKYPVIFKGSKLSPMESCMAFGLEVGDGWLPIIDALCNSIDHPYETSVMVLGKHLEHDCPQVIALQVKEKYGGLRFYYHLESTQQLDEIKLAALGEYEKIMNDFSRYVDGAIAMAEEMCKRTCEVRGTPGTLLHSGGSPYGWMKTLCPEEALIQGYATSPKP
jgi:hypothetical protein